MPCGRVETFFRHGFSWLLQEIKQTRVEVQEGELRWAELRLR